MPKEVDMSLDGELTATYMRLLRDESGQVSDPSRLVCFLYLLARDHLPIGEVEQALMDVQPTELDGDPFEFTNGWLARWAQRSAELLS